MKKTRFLIALLVMLVAASGYAQDSYRQTVKDYLTAVDQFEKQKTYISTMSMMFERDGKEDIEQLTKRYLDERYEDDMIDFYVAAWTEQGITEADLRELSSLLTTPEFEVFTDHTKDWMMGFASYMMTPFMNLLNMDKKLEGREYMDKVKESVSMIESPVEPRPEIDAAYAEKFNQVMLESPIVKILKDSMLKRFEDKGTSDDPVLQESDNKVKDWAIKNVPVLLLNYAYDNLTIEDLDYAAKLYTNEVYSKLQNFDLNNFDMESLKKKHTYLKYLEWMEEQGAKTSKDPQAVFEFFNSLFESIKPTK